MKNIYAFCFLFIMSVASYAQVDCQYQNQGFEDWYDATSIYFEPGEEPSNPIFLPDNHIPLFRFITMAFAGGFFLNLEQKNTMLFGELALVLLKVLMPLKVKVL